MKKAIFFLVLLAIPAALLAGFWYGQQNNGSNQSATKSNGPLGAQIAWVDGNVEYKQGDGEWKRATAGLNLAQGDSLETLADGKAIINLDDGSILRLDKESRIVLASLSPEHFVITNESGQVYSRVAKSDRIFEVAVGKNIFQSLGTAYKTINQSGYQGVEVYESKVKAVCEDMTETVVEEGNKFLTVNEKDKATEKKVAKIDAEATAKDEFYKWNKAEDQKAGETVKEIAAEATTTEVTKEEPASEPVVKSTASGITLTAVKVANGIKFTWQVSGVDTDSGFKLVKSMNPNPVYPGDTYQYLSNSEQRSYTWVIKDGKTYNFRVCQYLGGKCGVYSNNVKIAAPLVQEESAEEADADSGVNSLSLSSSGGGKVSWSVNGYSASGFKLVWSKNSAPTYPCREGDKYNYYSNPSTVSGSLEAFDGAGTYYVRVCEYLGGKCGVYSNQITVNLGE